MIIKSMSRKVPSFGQLIGYIDRDEGADEYRLRHNVFARDPELMRTEFERNGDLLKKRKNGVYLYHEILSITRAKGLSAEEQKSRLRDIAETYIGSRCPDNLVFGNLHQDKEHSYHYHLMISSNRAGETGRLRLTKKQFREVQVQMERHVLQTYPELEQKLAIDKRSDRGRKKGEAELERRTGQRPKREEVLDRVLAAYDGSQDRQSLLDALGREGLDLYVRGKTLGVVDLESGKKHRLKTLDLEMADRVAIRMEGGEVETAAEELEQEPEQEQEIQKEPAAERDIQTERERKPKRKRDKKRAEREKEKDGLKRASDENERNADNESYVINDSNTDLNRDPISQQPDRVPDVERTGLEADVPEAPAPEVDMPAGEGVADVSVPPTLGKLGDKLVKVAQKVGKQAKHEIEEAGKLLRFGITGQDEEIGKTIKEKEDEEAQDQKEPETEQSLPEQDPAEQGPPGQSRTQQSWRDEMDQRRGNNGRSNDGKDGPDRGRE